MAALDVKASAAAKDSDPDDWIVAVAVRHATKSDPAVMQRVSKATDSSISHTELVAQYRCTEKCQWCDLGVEKTARGRHFVIFTVRDLGDYSGVMKLYKPPPRLWAKGSWTLYRVNATKEQYAAILSYCESQVGAPYRSLTKVACSKVCCTCCCGSLTYDDIAAMRKEGTPGPKRAIHCSGLVASALIYADLLPADPLRGAIDPYTITPAGLVDEMRPRQAFTKLDSIPPDLNRLPSPPSSPRVAGPVGATTTSPPAGAARSSSISE